MRQAAKKAADGDTLDLDAFDDPEDTGVDLNLVMSAARMHRLRHNAGGLQVRFHRLLSRFSPETLKKKRFFGYKKCILDWRVI